MACSLCGLSKRNKPAGPRLIVEEKGGSGVLFDSSSAKEVYVPFVCGGCGKPICIECTTCRMEDLRREHAGCQEAWLRKSADRNNK